MISRQVVRCQRIEIRLNGRILPIRVEPCGRNVIMLVFALLATFIGVPELSMVYVPILLPLLIALGYDSIVAAAVALCATGLGYSVGVFNPLNTGLAQQLADLPHYSGYPLRIALLAVLLAISIGYIMRYAHRLARNPARGLMAHDATERDKRERYQEIAGDSGSRLSKRQWLAALLALGCLAFLIFGVTRLGWYMTEISGLFVLMTLLVGAAAGLAGETICESFTDGCRDVMMGALVVGIARGGRSGKRPSTGYGGICHGPAGQRTATRLFCHRHVRLATRYQLLHSFR